MTTETARSPAPELWTDNRVSVLIPLALYSAYDYTVPADLDLKPGDFVAVPLGKRQVTGVVWGDGSADIDVVKLKPVTAKLDLPPLPEVSRRFIDWVAGYSMAPLGAVLRMAMSVPDALEPERALKAWSLGTLGAAKITAA